MDTVKKYQEWFERHSTQIAAASVITTTCIIIYYQHKYGAKMLLEVTQKHWDLLRTQSGGIVYDFPTHQLYLTIHTSGTFK